MSARRPKRLFTVTGVTDSDVNAETVVVIDDDDDDEHAAARDTPALEQPRAKRLRVGAHDTDEVVDDDEVQVVESDESLCDDECDFTRTLAHNVFMALFDLLPTRQWASLGLVSHHWRRMQVSNARAQVSCVRFSTSLCRCTSAPRRSTAGRSTCDARLFAFRWPALTSAA